MDRGSINFLISFGLLIGLMWLLPNTSKLRIIFKRKRKP